MRTLADIVLILHFAWVLAILLPIPLIMIGARKDWLWVRNRTFRITHLAMIGIVVFEAVIGMVCPLTLWENALRSRSELAPYGKHSFIEYWIGRVLFYDFPSWVFTVTYLVIGLLIIALFWLVPTRERTCVHRRS